jgi:hypothetical protein
LLRREKLCFKSSAFTQFQSVLHIEIWISHHHGGYLGGAARDRLLARWGSPQKMFELAEEQLPA